MEIKREEILRDYRLAMESREASLIGRREVFSGKAKFGIFGDGKEVAQVAMAKAFRKGDFRSGYYRDQTLMMALGELTLEQFFAQLYAHADVQAEPATGGRSMNSHFGTRSLDDEGRWKMLTEQHNSSADVSPTASQMPRLLGLAQASKLYRQLGLDGFEGFSRGGDEIAWGTIGNASCAEGMFWETVNAAGVLQVPMLLSIWDDDYGISVPNKYQIAKQDLSAVLSGFRRSEDRGGERSGEGGEVGGGIDLLAVRGWDYPALCEAYLMSAEVVRKQHVPTVIHVTELTQPQGHSTSGAHERYKSEERLAWEQEWDCLRQMRRWMIEQGIADEAELDEVEKQARQAAGDARDRAWAAYIDPIREDVSAFAQLARDLASAVPGDLGLEDTVRKLESKKAPLRRDILSALHKVLIAAREHDVPARRALVEWRDQQLELAEDRYSSHLYSASEKSVLSVPVVAPQYADDAPRVNGFEVVNACFDANLEKYPHLVAFGEDVGYLGDVNQGMSGMQEKYGKARVSDTGIRETTILGQAIGMAMRGLRPIAEVQYLDYLLYALQIMSDDLATVQYRTKGGQKAPVIVRTRGHRLEGIWHSGSPMGGIVHLVRGMHVCVPRDMTRAAGFYNTLLQSDEPALVVEVLNGYRVKEPMPSNIGELTVPLGVPEVLREGGDVTLVTYGACCRIALDAAETLSQLGIEVEVVDVQTLLPFDLEGRIVESVRKTNRLVVMDEDVPGGASAYILRQILERQRAFPWLDSEPRTLTSTAHRPAYGSDGDYFSKPNAEQVFETVYELMHEAEPQRFPLFYR
ncbi:MAG: thiamine pyrophosphate-dependent enzyme [Acidobacteriota bacterium]|nr:thiamine pyrophosphate-dependent enzyme [Acidobacteriota bacterium]